MGCKLSRIACRSGAERDLEALVRTTGAASALGGDAQVDAKVAQSAGAVGYRILDMALGDGIANTNVHRNVPVENVGAYAPCPTRQAERAGYLVSSSFPVRVLRRV